MSRRRTRDLTDPQNSVVRSWARRLLRPPLGTGKLTQAELAAKLGIGQPQVSHFVGRELHGTSWHVAFRLAELVGVDVRMLYALDPPPGEPGVPPEEKSGERRNDEDDAPPKERSGEQPNGDREPGGKREAKAR